MEIRANEAVQDNSRRQKCPLEDYCHSFDLASTIPATYIEDGISKGQIIYYNPGLKGNSDPLDGLITKLVSCLGASQSHEKSPLRICINNLGSFAWGGIQSHLICRFLLRLRTIVRNTNSCALITLPPHLSDANYAPHWVSKLGHLSDGCLTLQGITSDPVLAPTFPSYSGLLKVHATPSAQTLLDPSRRFSQLRGLNSTNSATGTGGGENNLAFKCMRKRLVVETLHLDVEGGVGERRTTPAASAVVDPIVPHVAHEEVKRETQLARIMIDTPPERPSETAPKADEPVQKKARKKVAFRTAESDLYDF